MTTLETTGIRGVSLVCLTSADQDKSVEFYTALGFDKRVDTPFGGNYRWIEVYPSEGSTGLALAPPPQGGPVEPLETGITLTTSDIEKTHQKFTDLGVDVDTEVSRLGDPVPPMFWFRDPDGHHLMVVEQA